MADPESCRQDAQVIRGLTQAQAGEARAPRPSGFCCATSRAFRGAGSHGLRTARWCATSFRPHVEQQQESSCQRGGVFSSAVTSGEMPAAIVLRCERCGEGCPNPGPETDPVDVKSLRGGETRRRKTFPPKVMGEELPRVLRGG